MKLTKLEKEIFEKIDIIADGFAETPDYILECLRQEGYDIKIVRGVIGSLVKKGKLLHQGDAIYINEE